MSKRSFTFDGYTLDLGRGCLRAGERDIQLRPKSFETLRVLVENAGHLVTKDQLLNAVWPNVVVGDESLARCISEVREAINDGAQRLIKTVPRRGYLFAAPVSNEGEPIVVTKYGTIDALPPRLSIVVLPFTNLSNDGLQDYFVDAITDSLTTDPSRIRGAVVIARGTAFTYKSKATDTRQVGRELNVRYVMEGSVFRSDDRVRINAQLIDAETRVHVWAEHFDSPVINAFETLDAITARLARTAGIELVAAEGRRSQSDRVSNLDSMDLTLRGWAVWNQPRCVDSAREARALFGDALRLDDHNIDALIGLADALAYESGNFMSENHAQRIRSAEIAVSKALALAPHNAYAHCVHGRVLECLPAPEAALREHELAISLNSNLVQAHARAGLTKVFLGRADETEAHVLEALRLSPRDPLAHSWHSFMGIAALYLGRLERAVDHCRRSIDTNPNYEIPYFYLAAALALAGRSAAATAARVAGQSLASNFTIRKFRAEARGDNPIYLAQRKPIVEGMRKAGVRE